MNSCPAPSAELHTAFVEARPRLLSLAHRLLGSLHDAEDAVQNTWIRVSSHAGDDIVSYPAWLTTAVTSVCLDQLRQRQRRHLLDHRADPAQFVERAADEDFLRREDVGRALMVLLSRLSPTQRVAYVLHDLFAVPFDQVAVVLDVTPTSAKKLASRARARLRPADRTSPVGSADPAEDDLVDAFLRAAAGGDMHRMIAMLAPGCVRAADPELLPAATPALVTGATAVAQETRLFVERIRCSTPMRVNGRNVHVIAPGGHPLATIDIQVQGGLITRITLSAVRDGDVLEPARQPSGKCDL
ncbi:sigma-70 family RNA polymerase sigma factor [Mycobacterium sp. smrl_JER01]|uniref:sigma-70 family RNA polymerase sigma factor n=1 Tax=Mycobacterium sp. smrl_JER01 TaxID=3402633 RepID=UPI003AC7D118